MTIPLDREEFDDDAARGSEFVASYVARAQRHGLVPWSAYERFARLCRALVDDAAELGVTIITRARVEDFVDALASHDTVTLLAHSRGPEITEGDIVDVERVRASALAMMARLGIPESLPSSTEGLARYLDAALGEEDTTDADGETLSETQLFARRTALFRERASMREQFEEAAGDAIRGGPGVEFRGGVVRNEDLSSRIPRVPTLDLTVCDSVLLAECIRRRRTEGVILSNPQPTTPDFRLALYREAVRHSLRYREPYADAVIRIRRHLKGPRSHDVRWFRR